MGEPMRKIIFKGNLLTKYKGKKNIRLVLEKRLKSEENLWYWDSHYAIDEMARTNRTKMSLAAGCTSAVSPMTNWDDNIEMAEQKIVTGHCKHTDAFNKKADAVLVSGGSDDVIWDILNGNKIQNFYMNLMYPNDKRYVTVDRHAISIVLGRTATKKENSLTDKQYEFFADCYREVAKDLQMIPNLVQSITWQTWRRIK